ncbi:unnamed protein product [Adineta steineri]|uniref:Uncharacterized protein n=1 Tax=Adineta steineri TaxID=433720 RepID=A0A819AA57_9BILA|nr:unnamed protein product [Adineta steineri]
MPPSAVPLSSTIINDNSSDSSYRTTSTLLVPPSSLPKHFNVPFAIQHGYFRSVRYLLELHYDPNERDSQLRTSLILCAYIENDRWRLSLVQNLLEKGAKIALDDHTRRNAMHHACALQRIELVQLYLSCLDYNLEAQDCEGNTCLHYIAIVGNCEIAELLMKAAEKFGINLDRYVNRDGCSAAVLALKYGHLECANQITHRDCDEFYMVPRPLSIYENNSTIIKNSNGTKLKKKNQKSSVNKTEIYPPVMPFGLLKIIFNDNDMKYSTHLANICKKDKQIRHVKYKKQEAPQISSMTNNNNHNTDRTKSAIVNGNQYSSTQVLINETHLLNRIKKHQTHFDSNEISHNTGRLSPRMQLLIHQQRLLNSKDNNSSYIQKATSKTQLSIDDINSIKLNNSSKTDSDNIRYKQNIPTMHRQISVTSSNQSDTNPPRITNHRFQRPKTTTLQNQTFMNSIPTAELNSTNLRRIQNPSTPLKKRFVLNDRTDTSSVVTKQNQSTAGSQSSTYPQTILTGYTISTATQQSTTKSNDLSCPIQEAKGPTSRYNKPEQLFGLRPEELFGLKQHQPKMFDQMSTTKTDDSIRSKRSQLQKKQHIWQQDVDKLLELYNIHHSVTYRKSAIPPPTTLTQGVVQTETITEIIPIARSRRSSITKHTVTTSKPPTNHSKQTTVTSGSNSRRNSTHRHTIKLANT